LPVSDWDGHGDTMPGFPLAGPVIMEETEPDALRRTLERVWRWLERCPPETLARWQTAYIAWLRRHEPQSGDRA
jgi:hypothetical protein